MAGLLNRRPLYFIPAHLARSPINMVFEDMSLERYLVGRSSVALIVHSRLGDSKDRDPSLVKLDAFDGLVSPYAAREIYGFDVK